MKKPLSDPELHSAGATIRRKSPFDSLGSYENEVAITQEFRETWIIPYYMKLGKHDMDWIKQIKSVKGQITDEIILRNLGDFNWRSRSTGSFFAAIQDANHLTEIIGTHLLKSEICFAGDEYASTLAVFNSKKAIDYLIAYLEYYLTRFDLDFNQTMVLKAIKYLDHVNNTSHALDKKENWLKFLRGKQEYHQGRMQRLSEIHDFEVDKFNTIPMDIEWAIALDTRHFEQKIRTIHKIRA